MTKEYTTTSSREDVRRGLRHRFHSQPIFGHSEFETKKIFDSLDPESTKKRPTSVWMNQWSKDQDGDKQMPGKQDEKEGTNPDRQDGPEKKSDDNKPMMSQNSGDHQKEGSGQRQGQQERQTPEQESQSQRRSGSEPFKKENDASVHALFLKNAYLLT